MFEWSLRLSPFVCCHNNNQQYLIRNIFIPPYPKAQRRFEAGLLRSNFLLSFLTGDAAPPKITVHSGETADLFYHKTSYESSEYFRGYRVQKDGVSFRYMKPGSNRSNCTENTTSKEFCVNRTEFTGVNASHLLLKIKETEVNDSGNYSLHSLFKLLHNDSLEEIILKVIKLKVHGKSVKNVMKPL